MQETTQPLYHIERLDKEAKDFGSALGISKTRMKELGDGAQAIFDKSVGKSDAFEPLLEIINTLPRNFEEVVFCSFGYGHNIANYERQLEKHKKMKGTIDEILKQALRRNKDADDE